MKARSMSTCAACTRAIRVGDDISKLNGSWVHQPCAEYGRNIARIESGETYRSQAPSTWTRKPRGPRGMT